MLRAPRKELLRRLAQTSFGAKALRSLALSEPHVLIEALGPRVNRGARFSSVRSWPDRLSGFEDLAFLFSSHQLHHAIISMAVDEAAYLYRLTLGLDRPAVVEIGRSKGGSTLLLAAAVGEAGHVWSYDLYVKSTAGRESDEELRSALERYALRDRVTLIVGDSRTAEPPPVPCTLVLVDGDHSYEGVRADFETWGERVAPGGHIVFHDAAAFGPLNRPHPTVARFVSELERDRHGFVRRGGAGTLLHFQRTG